MKKERPGPVIFGKTIKEHTPWGNIYVTMNYDGAEPFEVFITFGKSGSELNAMTEALARVISIGLRSGCHLEDFIDTLRGLSGKEVWMLEWMMSVLSVPCRMLSRCYWKSSLAGMRSPHPDSFRGLRAPMTVK